MGRFGSFVITVLLLANALLYSDARQPTPATIPAAVRDAASAITAGKLGDDLAYLASDGLMGRPTPSPGLEAATARITDRLTQWKIRSAGDDGGYLQ